MSQPSSDPDRDRAVQIVAMFSALIHAWQHNEFERAAQARSELAELGVMVTMPRRRQSREEDNDAK